MLVQGCRALQGLSGLGLLCLFGGAVTLCIHFSGMVEGSPGRPQTGRGPWTANLCARGGSGEEPWYLGHPGGGKKA